MSPQTLDGITEAAAPGNAPTSPGNAPTWAKHVLSNADLKLVGLLTDTDPTMFDVPSGNEVAMRPEWCHELVEPNDWCLFRSLGRNAALSIDNYAFVDRPTGPVLQHTGREERNHTRPHDCAIWYDYKNRRHDLPTGLDTPARVSRWREITQDRAGAQCQQRCHRRVVALAPGLASVSQIVSARSKFPAFMLTSRSSYWKATESWNGCVSARWT